MESTVGWSKSIVGLSSSSLCADRVCVKSVAAIEFKPADINGAFVSIAVPRTSLNQPINLILRPVSTSTEGSRTRRSSLVEDWHAALHCKAGVCRFASRPQLSSTTAQLIVDPFFFSSNELTLAPPRPSDHLILPESPSPRCFTECSKLHARGYMNS
ncbi:hypothetical protein AURANDRAFT_67336 [Aureococcus anophagefferens]|uniref:Uncharacterized protein n=1 Tax=Aureococcus anophagefferens TaxID=44056 RepID=F0YKT5_AURAN|nr:hypothetical protein AURANDRAFT_67336 [Aureococcus anophagefferens]EGB04309.1 hypothetical protein AURANDRAFT_67336 [Aureococcus anophagefferens]|eukprot:XP_009041019.1 hypothetical protein AURANDRAFT_67336 [Aureococcus anophagefferens]